MLNGCCGPGRCYCLVTGGAGISVTGTGAKDNPFVVTNTGAGGGGAFYLVSDYGGVDGGLVDSQAAVNDAITAARLAGGGIVLVDGYFGWTGDIDHDYNVTVMGLGNTGFGMGPTGLVALDDTARYRYGNLIGPENKHPAPLMNLTINGAGVGGATELLRIESVDSQIRNVSVVDGAGDGAVFAAAQNTSWDGGSIDNFPNGAGLVFRNRDDWPTNTQGAGNCRVSNLHITACKKLVLQDYVITNFTNLTDPLAPGYDPMQFWPHDNMISDSILEQYQDIYDCLIHVADGEMQVDKTVITGSRGTGPAAEDCVILLENEIRPSQSTKITITNSYGGGGNAAPTDLIRSNSYGLANTFLWNGMAAIANVDYAICDDRLGGGAGVVGGFDGQVTTDSGVIAMSRGINGGNAGVFYNKRRMPLRLEMDSAQGNPLQIRRNTDSSNRYQIVDSGNCQWLDGSVGTVRGSIVRDGASNVMGLTGRWSFTGGLLRSFVTTPMGGDAAVTINAATTSVHEIYFQVNGADATSVTINYEPFGSAATIIEGTQLRIGLFGTGTNVVTWPASIVFRTTAPQPVDGAWTYVDLTYRDGAWREVTRSPEDSYMRGHVERSVDNNNPQSITSGGSAQAVLWQTSAVTARGGISYNAGTGVFTVTRPGRYSVNAWIDIAANATGRRQFNGRHNGNFRSNTRTPAPASGTWSGTSNFTVDCVAGDTFDFTAFQDSGGGLNVAAGYVTITGLGR